MTKQQLEDAARTFGCLIDTNHSSGKTTADVWVYRGEKKERIGFTTEVKTLTSQKLIPILVRVSGKTTAELGLGSKGGSVA